MKTIRNSRRRQRLRQTAIASLGYFCQACGETRRLELAHTKPTKLAGRGRGSIARYTDAIKHLDCYRLLCRDCHVAFDSSKDSEPLPD